MNSESLELLTKYEIEGFITGANARLHNSGYNVILLSNPRIDEVVDNQVRVWVAMEFDTHVRFLASVEDLVLLK
jgi:hypothetical protein